MRFAVSVRVPAGSVADPVAVVEIFGVAGLTTDFSPVSPQVPATFVLFLSPLVYDAIHQ